MKNRKKVLLLLGISICVMMFIGVTYALWQVVLEQSGSNVLTSGCFRMTLEEVDGSEINLEKAYPIVDEDGMELTPYKFKLVNTCDTKAGYSIALETLNTSDLSEEYLKVMLNDGTPSILSSKTQATPILENASKSYVLESGYLNGNEEKEYELRIWLDEDAPATNGVMNRTWSGKVTINANMVTEIPKGPGMLRVVDGYEEYDGMWEYKHRISKIVIQNELNPIEGATKVSDESAIQDGSVMSYVVLNEDGTSYYPKYTVYLQSTDSLILNPNSSGLFYDFSSVTALEGLEFLDTSNVTDMSYMFGNMWSLNSLDLSSFNTSKVTNMSHMFYGMNSLTSLDVSSFDTSNVTNMSSMFCMHDEDDGYPGTQLLNLDLSSFNTGNVTDMSWMFSEMTSLTDLSVSNFNTSKVTNMSGMFDGMRRLTSLDVSNFDTAKVTNMSGMFSGMRKLENLNLGENFDTSKVTSMSHMFSYMSSITSLDVSSFDTSNVTHMGSMFREMSSVTSLDLSNFDTGNVTDMNWMFSEMSSITSLDLSSFDTSNVTNMNGMFNGNRNLSNITYGNNFIRKENSSVLYMFTRCPANHPTHESWTGAVFD